jgi:RHS repeat-associated protein
MTLNKSIILSVLLLLKIAEASAQVNMSIHENLGYVVPDRALVMNIIKEFELEEYAEAEVETHSEAIQDSTIRGNKQYELTNHLSNVLATISDRRIQNTQIQTGTSGIIAELTTATDYYAFGMQIPGRNFSSGNYRFGFNGKENDNEVKGDGNQQDYGFRVYDPRVGKFLSIDPLTKDYPELTPYQFASNTPIMAIDLDGLEAVVPRNNVVVNVGLLTITRTFNVALYPGVGMTIAQIAAAMPTNRIVATGNEVHEQREHAGGGLFFNTLPFIGTDIINFAILPALPPNPQANTIYLQVNPVGGATNMQEKVVPYPTSAGKVTGTGSDGGWGSGTGDREGMRPGILTEGFFTLNQGNIAVNDLANTFVPGGALGAPGAPTALNLLRISLNNPKLCGIYKAPLIDEKLYGHLFSDPVTIKDAKNARGGSYKVK